jgi:hypothetical protein
MNYQYSLINNPEEVISDFVIPAAGVGYPIIQILVTIEGSKM